MKIPEKAPDWIEVLKKTIPGVQGSIYLSLQDVIKKANKEYIYWDDFKYLDLPEGIKPEQAWTALKIARTGQSRKIKLTDNNEKHFSYLIPDSALNELHFIDQNAAGQMLVDDPVIHEEEKPRYIMSSLVEEAITSSQIEGAATTRAVAKEMLRTGRKPRDYAEKMIYNNFITITWIKDFVNQPLTPSLLREIHGHITRDTLDDASHEGAFRKEEVNIYNADGQTILHSPPPASTVEGAIKLLCEFANEEDEEDFIHPVIRAIILHFWLAYLHPFMDRNGRTARALFYWFVLKKKYWLFEYLSISRIILKKRIQYYKSFLYSEIDHGDMTYFIMFHLRAIRDAITELREYLKRKQRESRQAIRFLEKYPDLNSRQRTLLASALEHPEEIYTFEKHANVHRIVYETARTDILGLHKHGLLHMRKEGRKFYFSPVDGLKEKLQGEG